MTIVHESRHARLIHDHLGGHAPQLEQVDFLPVQLEHAGLGVRQSHEGQTLLAPMRRKGSGVFWSHDKHLRLPFGKFTSVLAQLRQVTPAEWSNKATVEHE